MHVYKCPMQLEYVAPENYYPAIVEFMVRMEAYGVGKEEELGMSKEEKREYWNNVGRANEPPNLFLINTFTEMLERARRCRGIDPRLGKEILQKIVFMGQSDIHPYIPTLHINFYLYRALSCNCWRPHRYWQDGEGGDRSVCGSGGRFTEESVHLLIKNLLYMYIYRGREKK
jgi:hypothetical protein